MNPFKLVHKLSFHVERSFKILCVWQDKEDKEIKDACLLTLRSSALGDFIYSLVLSSSEMGMDHSLRFTASLGNKDTKTFRFTSFSTQSMAYSCKIDSDMFSVQNSIKVRQLLLLSFIHWTCGRGWCFGHSHHYVSHNFPQNSIYLFFSPQHFFTHPLHRLFSQLPASYMYSITQSTHQHTNTPPPHHTTTSFCNAATSPHPLLTSTTTVPHRFSHTTL
jgi:hypothetical protein